MEPSVFLMTFNSFVIPKVAENMEVKKAVKKWYGEKKNFDTKWRTSKNGGFEFQSNPVIGHYTQVVWADTYKVSIELEHY